MANYPPYQQQSPQQYDQYQQYPQHQQYDPNFQQYPSYEQQQGETGYPQTFSGYAQPFPGYQVPDANTPQPVLQAPPGEPLPEPPVAIAQQAIQQGLGDLRAVYKPRVTSAGLLLGSILALIALDAGLVYLLFTRLQIHNRFIFFIAAIPILGIIYAMMAFSHINHRVYLYTAGIIYARGLQLTTVRWDEVRAVYHRWTRQGSGEIAHRYVIQREQGEPIKLGNVVGSIFMHITELGSIIEYEVAQTLFPHAQAAYNAGQEITFGSIRVNLQGIHSRKKTISWDKIDSVELQQGKIVVRKDGRTKSLPRGNVSEVPNVPLLIQMVTFATGKYW